METVSGKELLDRKVELNTYGYPIEQDETYVADHYSDLFRRDEYVTKTAWDNSHHYPTKKPVMEEYEEYRITHFHNMALLELFFKDKSPRNRKQFYVPLRDIGTILNNYGIDNMYDFFYR
jgi:hypothetical protein